MSQNDNLSILYINRKVNLLCDGEKLQLRYEIVDGMNCSEWFINGEHIELQVSGLIKMLRCKYKNIKVTWKRQF